MIDSNMEKLYIPGFRAGGVASGIKNGGKKDLALIAADEPAVAAGLFTTNSFKAAPVLHGIRQIKSRKVQAVMINSGCANAATGDEGMVDAERMAAIAAGNLAIDKRLVMIASTGSIGSRLPIGRIEEGTPRLVESLSPDGIEGAAEAIMTTDRYPKIAARRISIGGKDVTLCGIAKGAGMIEPHMATMLAFFMTDASVESDCLLRLFKKAMDQSFNAITVDGCMSTNDMALILAGGKAGNRPIRRQTPESAIFLDALLEVSISLSAMIVRDGEGATKLIDIIVEGARTRNEAKRIAYAVGRSSLVKTAFYGGDPNWGRIISAAGAIGIPIPPDETELYFDGEPLFRGGRGVSGNEEKIAAIMKKDTISVLIKLDMGTAKARVFAADLTHDYIDINAHYHT